MGDGAGAVIPAGSKLGLGAGAEKAQNSWARLFANFTHHGIKLVCTKKICSSLMVVYHFSILMGTQVFTVLLIRQTCHFYQLQGLVVSKLV